MDDWMPIGEKNGGWDGICVNDRSGYHGRFSFVAMSPYPVHDGTKGVIAGLWIFFPNLSYGNNNGDYMLLYDLHMVMIWLLME